jgi:serine phosphatase RsbU (regulator of sigma subunit)/PAS domain-containing protein
VPDPRNVASHINPEVARRELVELSIDAAGIGTFDWDLVGGTLDWDSRLIELFGYDDETFDRSIKGFNARLHPEDAERVGNELEIAIDTCGDFVSEYRIVLDDGAIRWIGARGRTLCDDAGGPVRLLGAAWDISNRAQTEAQVVRALKSMSTAFFSLDRSWRFTFANSEAERVLDTPGEELIGAILWDLFPAAAGSEFEVQYRHAMEQGEAVSFDAYYPAPLDSWFEVRAWPNADGLSVYFLDVTTRHLAQEENAQAARRAELLALITEQMSATLDSEEAAKRLAHLVVPTLAEWCIVTLIDDDKEAGTRRGLRRAFGHHADPQKRSIVSLYAEARLDALQDDEVVVRAMESGQAQFIDVDTTPTIQAMIQPGPVRELLGLLEPAHVIVLPLIGRNGPVGMLSLANDARRGPFSHEDLVTAGHVSGRAGLVLDNARLYRQQRELAEGLQRSLLTEPAEPDHLQVVVRYAPAAETAQVGGDWYDAFLQTNGAMTMVIGDVIGHDTEAASAMGQIRSIVRTVGAVGTDSPSEILDKVDQVMETLQIHTTATAVVARLEQTDHEIERQVTRMRWSSAGHLPPMVIHPDGHVAELGDHESDVLLGVMIGAERREYEIELPRDAIVVLYTDGLVERRGQSLDAGLQHLRECLTELADCDLDTLCDALLARLLPPSADDDVALLAVKLHPQNKPRPAEAGPNRIPATVDPEPEIPLKGE